MKEPPTRREPTLDAERGPDPMDELKRREAVRDSEKRKGATIIPLRLPPD